jgi:hypothetical protein
MTVRRRRKIAISVSPDVLDAAASLRRETGESRSAVCERALRCLLDAERQAELSQQYVAAYRRLPESQREIREALGWAVTAFAAEPWDETR